MLSIDGLVTGLDTSSIIEGLLQIQQRQIDRLSARRADLLTRQSSFSGVEARLLSFRGALSRLSAIRNTAIGDKIVTTSDEDAVSAAASNNAAFGVYRLRVDRLASSHQVATSGFASTDVEIGTGSFDIRLGETQAVEVKVDDQNNTLQGLVDAINRSDAAVTASIVNDGSPENPYRLMLTSDETGASQQISINDGLTGGEPLVFDLDNPVQEALNAQISFGSGPGAISVESETNTVQDLIAGVTLDLRQADPANEITLVVEPDVETGVAAVEEFVNAYNDFISYVNDQVRYNAEADIGGPLLGDRSVIDIQDQIQFAMTGIVEGLDSQMNRLTSVGVSVTDNGTLALNTSRLEDVLSGRVDGVSAEDAARLFALSAESSNAGINFVVGSTKTANGSFEVDITSVADAASIIGANNLVPARGAPIVIDATNNELNLVVDGKVSSTLTLDEGSYTAEELAAHVESVINGDEELGGRDVEAVVEDGKLRITSRTIGSGSEVKILSGSAWDVLGFNGDEVSTGKDVEGHFIVDGVIETATGRGTLLTGDSNNAHTADLQLRVELASDDVIDGVDATVGVSRGLASLLDQIIGELTDVENGTVKNIKDRFTETDASIQRSIDLLNDQFESQQESLIKQFAALESAVGQLQNTASFLSAQFAGVSGLSLK